MKRALLTAAVLLAKLAGAVLAVAAGFALWWALYAFQPALNIPM